MSNPQSIDQILEQWVPYIGALALALSWYLYFKDNTLPEKIPKLVETIMNVYAVLIGFLATALAL